MLHARFLLNRTKKQFGFDCHVPVTGVGVFLFLKAEDTSIPRAPSNIVLSCQNDDMHGHELEA